MRKIILAVDNDENVLRSLGRVFRHKSFEFMPFDSPIKALHAMRTARPHVIISDNRMPHIKGEDFLSIAKSISQKSFRILLTGFSKSEDYDDHIDRVIAKPWCNEELENHVESTTVHRDRIVVELWDSLKKEENCECSLCGRSSVTHEIRYDTFTERLCDECRFKLDSMAGSYLEPMIMRQMMGNVL